MAKRIAVTGGRHLGMVEDKSTGEWIFDYQQLEEILKTLDILWVLAKGTDRTEDTILLSGACPTGLDYIAELWAEVRGIPVQRYKADWNKHGKAAGPIRNRAMIFSAEALISFPGGSGTRGCTAEAEARPIPVYRALVVQSTTET